MHRQDLLDELLVMRLSGTWQGQALDKLNLLQQLKIFTHTDNRFDQWLINRSPARDPAELYEELTIETVARYVQETVI